MSALTELGHFYGSLRLARDLLESPYRLATKPWWDLPNGSGELIPFPMGLRDVFNERLPADKAKAVASELDRVLGSK